MALQYPQFGGFSLGLEDEEARKRREAEIQGLAPSAPAPAAYNRSPSASAPDLRALIAPRDQEMDQRWLGAEQNALGRSSFEGGNDYGFAEAIRDFAPMALGSIADLAFNKGKGVPSVLAAGAQANVDQGKLRQQEQRDASNFALQARNQRNQVGNPEVDALFKEAQMNRWSKEAERGDANLEQRDIRQQFQELKLRLEKDKNDPQALAMAQALKEQTGFDVVGQLGAGNISRMMPIAGRAMDLQNADPKAYAAEKGRTRAELEDAPETTAAAAVKEGAVTTAGEAAKEATPRVYREQAEKFRTAEKLNLDMVGLMDEIDRGQGGYAPTSIAERFPDAIASFGIPADRLPTWQAKKLLIEEWARGQSGAAISSTEDKRFLAQLGQHPLQSEEATNAAYDTFKGLVHKRIAGGATGNTAARDVLRAYTSDPDAILGTLQPSAAPAGAQQNQANPLRAPLPAVPVVPESAGLRRPAPAAPAQTGPLGNTGKVPKFSPATGSDSKAPAKPGGVSRMRSVVGPDGSVERMNLTDEEAEYLMQQGARSVD